MCVILTSVATFAYGQYLTETYVDASHRVPLPPNHNPELHSRGEWLESTSLYFIFFGCIVMTIGFGALWDHQLTNSIIGMCVILISVGALAYGNYLTETYVGSYLGIPAPPNYNPELYSRGVWLEAAGPYFIILGCAIMAIGLITLWHAPRTTTHVETLD
jgi:hypothetical protein